MSWRSIFRLRDGFRAGSLPANTHAPGWRVRCLKHHQQLEVAKHSSCCVVPPAPGPAAGAGARMRRRGGNLAHLHMPQLGDHGGELSSNGVCVMNDSAPCQALRMLWSVQSCMRGWHACIKECSLCVTAFALASTPQTAEERAAQRNASLPTRMHHCTVVARRSSRRAWDSTRAPAAVQPPMTNRPATPTPLIADCLCLLATPQRRAQTAVPPARVTSAPTAAAHKQCPPLSSRRPVTVPGVCTSHHCSPALVAEAARVVAHPPAACAAAAAPRWAVLPALDAPMSPQGSAAC